MRFYPVTSKDHCYLEIAKYAVTKYGHFRNHKSRTDSSDIVDKEYSFVFDRDNLRTILNIGELMAIHGKISKLQREKLVRVANSILKN